MRPHDVLQSIVTQREPSILPSFVNMISFIYCVAFSIPVTIGNALENNKAKEIPNKNTMVNLGNKFLFLVNGL